MQNDDEKEEEEKAELKVENRNWIMRKKYRIEWILQMDQQTH